MSIARIVAIIIIYLVACAGWAVLGTTTWLRSDGSSDRLGEVLERSWGTPLTQIAPRFTWAGDPALPAIATANQITVGLHLDPRRKGLVWYPTYVCRFAGSYRLVNPEPTAGAIDVHFDFPASGATYDDFALTVDGQAVDRVIDTGKGVDLRLDLAPGQSRTFAVAYTTRGVEEWRYSLGGAAGRVQNLRLEVTTDFADPDFVDGSLSPMANMEEGSGRHLSWTTNDLITHQDIGIIVPKKLNPGPVTTRITFFAPVCLLFFFVLVATVNVVRRVDIHPMHYLFVAAGFFAFHLLLSYLVDHLEMHWSFLIAAGTSVLLVTAYLRVALARLPTTAVVAGQLFFLVLFSYSFFLKGMTGLTVAIGSVVTLAVLMAVTARTDWSEIFVRRPARPAPPAPAVE